ncbi:MAG TPA: hypothetical protein VMZ91_08645 [Candidatus Paceibacterota bacterium]|nr:hypothetical protein [Candidatus Paceibacterota bacterium]
MEKKYKEPTLKDIEEHFKRYRAMGMKPFLKGGGCGKVKIMFEEEENNNRR